MKNKSPNKQELISIINKTNNIHEVASHYNVPWGAVKCWITHLNIDLIPSKEDLLDKCWSLPFKECAKHYKVSTTTLTKWKQRYDISRYESKYGYLPTELTQKQNNIVIGKLLGDSWLNRTQGNTNNAFFVKQKESDEEYVRHVARELTPFSSKITAGEVPERIIMGYKSEASKYFAFATIASPIFTKLRKEWYPNDIKIIPRNLQLNWEMVAYWFCDDGYNAKSYEHYRTLGICTQCFTIEEVEFLMKLLMALDIKSSIKMVKCKYDTKPVIIIKAKSFEFFVESIRPYIPWGCMARKLHRKVVKRHRKASL